MFINFTDKNSMTIRRIFLLSVLLLAISLLEAPATAQETWNGIPKCKDDPDAEQPGEVPAPPSTKPNETPNGECKCMLDGKDLAAQAISCVPDKPKRCEAAPITMVLPACALSSGAIRQSGIHPEAIVDTTTKILPVELMFYPPDVTCNADCKPTAPTFQWTTPLKCGACWSYDLWDIDADGKKFRSRTIEAVATATAPITIPTDKLCRMAPPKEGRDGAVLINDCRLINPDFEGENERKCLGSCRLWRLNKNKLDDQGRCQMDKIIAQGDCTLCESKGSPGEHKH